MKNSNIPIGNRNRDLPACTAVPQANASTRVPRLTTYTTVNVLPVDCKNNQLIDSTEIIAVFFLR